jgi:hypothetical protein
VVGAAVGAGWGVFSGYVAGDRDWGSLTADGLAGGLTGSLAGLTSGASLIPGLLARAGASAGIEGLRQVANDAISGCVKEANYNALLFAAAGSLVGDGIGQFAGSAATESWGVFSHAIEASDEVIENFVGSNLSGLSSLPTSIVDYIRQHP